MSDEILRFIFDQTDIRGEWIQLEQSYRDTLANHHYPPGVGRLLGEFLAAAGLLGATLKVDGTIVLQARSDGQVPLIMAEATSARELRGIVRGAGQAIGTRFPELIGHGQLCITIDPTQGQRYQGIVPLEGHDLAACLEDYFRQSEQLPTRVWLAADEEHAAGLFLQELPSRADPEQRAHQWQHITTLAATVRPEELLGLSGEAVLHRLFHQEELRLLRRDDLCFRCSCSQQRTENMLLSLGRAELDEILAEQGKIDVNCEFCNQHYRFTADQVAALFAHAPAGRRH